MPSAAPKGGVAAALCLADPMLALHDGNGAIVATNDSWSDDAAQAALILASGLAPSDPREPAVTADLPPGDYTVVVSGSAEATGIALVEVYTLR